MTKNIEARNKIELLIKSFNEIKNEIRTKEEKEEIYI